MSDDPPIESGSDVRTGQSKPDASPAPAAGAAGAAGEPVGGATVGTAGRAVAGSAGGSGAGSVGGTAGGLAAGPAVSGEPAWRRRTQGEHRWPAALTVVVIFGLQASLPGDLVFPGRWVLIGLVLALCAVLVIANPGRINRESTRLRVVGLGLIAVVTVVNAWSVVMLVDWLVTSAHGPGAAELLRAGAATWVTNMLVFTLCYWELDRGGPAARAMGRRDRPDFLFTQMSEPSLAPDDWEPQLVDYLYLSFTNSTAFSPTDVLPLSRWAKLTMMLQSAISLVTVALVIARAVNVLN